MKYEEIKTGDVFIALGWEETVISKKDKYRFIVTINPDKIPTLWRENQLHYLKPIKEELPEEGLLVNDNGSLVYKLQDGSGYGFAFGNQSGYWFNKGWGSFSTDFWGKASPEQETKFIAMLKKECENRGLFEYTRIEAHAEGTLLADPDYMRVTPRFSSTQGYNKNGQIFFKGKFATPRKEEEPALELVSKTYLDLSKFRIEVEQEGNMLVINPIKK